MVMAVAFEGNGGSRWWEVLGGGVRGEECRCDGRVSTWGRLGQGQVRRGWG